MSEDIIRDGFIYQPLDLSDYYKENNVYYKAVGKVVPVYNKETRPYRPRDEAQNADWQKGRQEGSFVLMGYKNFYNIYINGKLKDGYYDEFSWRIDSPKGYCIPPEFRKNLRKIGERLNSKYSEWQCTPDRLRAWVVKDYGTHLQNTKISAMRYVELCEAFRKKGL